jgi:hypothetical protein
MQDTVVGATAHLDNNPHMGDVLDAAAQPQYVGKDLNDIADQIIARHGPGHG